MKDLITRQELYTLVSEAEADLDNKLTTPPGYGDALKHQQNIVFTLGALIGTLSFIYTQGDDAPDQESREISRQAELDINRLRRKYHAYWV